MKSKRNHIRSNQCNKLLKHLAKRFDKAAKEWRECQDYLGTKYEDAYFNDTISQMYMELAHELRRAVRKFTSED